MDTRKCLQRSSKKPLQPAGQFHQKSLMVPCLQKYTLLQEDQKKRKTKPSDHIVCHVYKRVYVCSCSQQPVMNIMLVELIQNELSYKGIILGETEESQQQRLRPSIIESSFIVTLQLQTKMHDAVDIWIISKFLVSLT